MIVKESGNINQLIIEEENINTLQDMYNFKEYVEKMIKFYPEAIKQLERISSSRDIIDWQLEDFLEKIS